MRPIPPNFIPPGFEVDMIYSFVIIVCSLMVYFGTKELYELSSHKGIKYFRNAFLFIALAYFLRSFIKFAIIYFDLEEIIELSPRVFGSLTLFLFMYLSSMAIFYLLYSVMWKKWNGNSNKIYLFHFLAVILSVLISTSRNSLIHFAINLFLFLLILSVVYISYKESKTKKKGPHNLFGIYLLLFIFLIFNILDIIIPHFLKTFQMIIYLASIGIFMLILYKVLKKIGN
jgi:hypothetical protein